MIKNYFGEYLSKLVGYTVKDTEANRQKFVSLFKLNKSLISYKSTQGTCIHPLLEKQLYEELSKPQCPYPYLLKRIRSIKWNE